MIIEQYNPNRKQGITFYDVPKYHVAGFTAAIDVRIDEVQYWRDRPKYIKTLNKSIPKDDPNIILAETTANEIIEYTTQIENILESASEGITDDTNFNQDIDLEGIPDSMIKETFFNTQDINNNLLQNITEISNDFDDHFKATHPDMSDDNLINGKYSSVIDKFNYNIEQWYGIPLISLGTQDTLQNEFILQIDTKHNHELHLLNISSDGAFTEELRITEVEVPPDKRFIAGVYVTQNQVSIYLEIEGDPKVYIKSITVYDTTLLNLRMYGSDIKGIKRLCGTIYDYFYWEDPQMRLPSETRLPYYPPDSYSFDMNSIRVRGSYIYTRRNWDKPAYNGGGWIDLEDWRFVKDGYLTNFFCRDLLNGEDFTIYWYQYHPGYSSGIKTLISDNINNNFIKYDYTNFQLIVEWQGVIYKEYITLPNYIWFQISVRFRFKTGELEIIFMTEDDQDNISVNVGPETVFELISIGGRLNQKTGLYTEIIEGIFGGISINQEFYNEDHLRQIGSNNLQILNNLRMLE